MPSNKHGNLNKAIIEPSPEMSQITGMVYGDGNLYHWKRDYRIGYYSTDKELVDTFEKRIKGVLPDNKISRWKTKPDEVIINNKRYSSLKTMYHAATRSKILFNHLSNKTKALDMALEKPEFFIRGFADAEGSFFIKEGHYTMAIDVVNKNEQVIDALIEAYKRIGIKSKSTWRKQQQYYRVAIRKKKFLKIYGDEVGSDCIRKKHALDKIMGRCS